MLDEKKIKEIEKRIRRLVDENIIIKTKDKRFVDFFLNNSKNSFDSATILYNISVKNELKERFGMPDFNGFLWVINSSYYSMFYMARALLENIGIKIKIEMSIHEITFDALVYYFYLTDKLEKLFIEDFAEARNEARQILGKEKAKELIEDYLYEKNKRAKFTYEMGKIVLQNKAKTSLERAKRFNEKIRKILNM